MKSFLSNVLRKPRRQAQVENAPQTDPCPRAWAVVDTPPTDHSPQNYFIRPDYRPRQTPQYFHDQLPGTSPKIYQPDVYTLAECFASIGKQRIIDVGCGKGEKLQALSKKFKIIGLDIGSNIEFCQQTYAFGRWIAHDFESDREFPLDSTDIQDSIVICADVIEHLVNPMPLLDNLKRCNDNGACVLLSTPERDIHLGPNDPGPPANLAHVREWTISEFRTLLLYCGFDIALLGITANNNVDRRMSTILAILK